MIIVTGTKRSGTSMWLQILRAAGFPHLGEAFPQDWGETIREANQAGFYESPLRNGIYHATNPHPLSGAFLHPRDCRQVAVKVFAMGLSRSDLAYVDRVVASMRPFREYAPSLERLLDMERKNRRSKAQALGQPEELELETMPPVLEWWRDNYTLIRDALVRRYPLHMVSYDAVLRAPETVIPETLAWLGAPAEKIASAVAAVRAELRTQSSGSAPAAGPSGVSAEHEQLFDELYARIDQRQPLDAAFIERMNHAHDLLAPQIAEAEATQRRARDAAIARARAARG